MSTKVTDQARIPGETFIDVYVSGGEHDKSQVKRRLISLRKKHIDWCKLLKTKGRSNNTELLSLYLKE